MRCPEVLIVGSIANFDVALANALSRSGMNCIVVRSSEVGLPDFDALPVPIVSLKPEDVILSEGPRWMYQMAKRSKCIVSFTGILPWMLREWWLAALLLPFPPIVNYTTGSDMTELIRERSLAGTIYRSIVRKAFLNVLFPYPEMIKSARRFRITNVMFVRFPYFLPSPKLSKIEGPITYLHPSHLDWGASDNRADRNSTKGNDLFLNAFFRALRAGVDIRCVIVDRGPDRDLAKQMIESSGFGDRFRWLPALTQKEFADEMDGCDIIVDQFDVGGFGGIAIEAMSKSKPVMIYIDSEAASLLYKESPPIINCRTEADIFEAIMSNLNREQLREKGEIARKWVQANHGAEQNLNEFVGRICAAAGIECRRH